jgi:hypothetical protein
MRVAVGERRDARLFGPEREGGLGVSVAASVNRWGCFALGRVATAALRVPPGGAC